MTPRTPLTKIGFFHFGCGHDGPIPMLEAAINDSISRGGMVADSLIVLPEAFNIRKPYFDPKLPDISPNIFAELARISKARECAFVTGTIVDDTPGVNPPYSSGCLIDGSLSKPLLLCRKLGRDNSEASRPSNQWSANYTRWTGPEWCRPMLHRGIAVAAMICMDAHYEQDTDGTYERFRRRCELFMEQLQQIGSPYKVIAIPACMSNGFGGGHPGTNVTQGTALEGTIQVLANRHSGHVNSFVSNVRGIVQEPVGKRDESRVEILRLASLI
jgi:predicted amidohydrolase